MPDYSFISTPPQNSGLKPISEMLDLAQRSQALQQGQQTIQRGDVALKKERALLQPGIDKGIAESETAQTGAKHAAFQLTKEQANVAYDIAGALALDPGVINGDPIKTIDAVAKSRKQMIDAGVPVHMAEGLSADLIAGAHKPGGVVQQLRNIATARAGPGVQAGVVNAPLQAINNGQRTQFVQPQPGAPNAAQPGQYIQNELPPTTPVFNGGNNTPGYLGPQPPGRAPQVQSGPALGVQSNIEGTSGVVNKDWETTATAARTAAQDVGVLQEIKKYAKGAVTGVESDRRAFIAGLAGLVGMDAGEIAKTDTDLLAKNAAMLAQRGGDTDLARTLTQMSNPNQKMTEPAIVKAANQVIAQRQMAILRQQVLAPFKDDPQRYTQAMTQFNAVADPRIIQLPTMTPQEKAKMKASMSPAEQAQFRQKLEVFERNGWVR